MTGSITNYSCSTFAMMIQACNPINISISCLNKYICHSESYFVNMYYKTLLGESMRTIKSALSISFTPQYKTAK